jgi:steroid 5-alpha reductase family enzyme
MSDASIVDMYWGLGFAVLAWIANILAGGEGPHGFWLAVLATIWGGRLSIYLYWRNSGHGEDKRYQAMRAKAGPDFAQTSRYSVFYLQAAIQWAISLPLQWAQGPSDGFGLLAVLGFLIFALGLGFEAIGDAQLAAFKANPANQGRVMDQGLWAWTRHPNYFGDACVWWGMTFIAIDGTGAWWLALSPIAMTYLLINVSGAALLERGLRKSRPEYDAYVARVSAFWPRPPR